ncbi:uncharacterized protein FTOL_12893 [Fusarium torulosum]|uniref:Uncharacterized protein n=1 Tax=Fusarium torulosum TaxID=33205 RepID=A0AAE8ML47_9HYPO|nr:uncharacterized protein FTOL_12893 [Fusarium torulosum]
MVTASRHNLSTWRIASQSPTAVTATTSSDQRQATSNQSTTHTARHTATLLLDTRHTFSSSSHAHPSFSSTAISLQRAAVSPAFRLQSSNSLSVSSFLIRLAYRVPAVAIRDQPHFANFIHHVVFDAVVDCAG